LLLIFYFQYVERVYSTQQLGASRIITTPFRTRITDNYISLLNCVTETDIKLPNNDRM